MTIRKQLMLVIGLIILLALATQALFSAGYIRNYYSGVVASEYNDNVASIQEQAVTLLSGDPVDVEQAAQTLSVYLGDLISEISVLDQAGHLVVAVVNPDAVPVGGMMDGGMMNRHRSETDTFNILQGNARLGTLIIVRSSAIQDTASVQLFTRALMVGALMSGVFVLIISIVIILVVSAKMTRALRQTAQFASNADLDQPSPLTESKIIEIRAIQTSLENLSAKLRLQKRTRQGKIDQLSHEVRTPLAILKSNCEGALDKLVTMDDSRLESCLNEIDHLAAILDTIPEVIEYAGEAVRVLPSDFDLTEALKKIAKGLQMQFDRKGLTLSLECDRHLPVTTDRAMLSQAVYNLLTNAAKFTPNGGQVTLSAHASAQAVIIKVSDTGPGIPPQDIKRIFEAYQRGSSPGDVPGDGLGLYIARQNVEALGGRIAARNLASGACFTIELPKAAHPSSSIESEM